jgi:hypothetical protein
MSTPESNTPKLQRNQMYLVGRIAAVQTKRDAQNRYIHHIATPAADEFSRPQELDVRSKVRLGAVGDPVSLVVSWEGYQQRFTYKDKETGEVNGGSKIVGSFAAVE